MGSTISILSLPSVDIVKDKIFGLAEDIQGALKFKSFNADDLKISVGSVGLKRNGLSVKQTPDGSSSLRNWEAEAPSENQNLHDERKLWVDETAATNNAICSSESISPRPRSELDAAAVKVQKVYRSYRTRRNLADCAVVVEELWWKALDYALLKRSSVSFFNGEKSETAISRWARARTRAAKVGKGLSKSNNAQKLALRHWLEAIDPRHRYGHNLHMYYDVWFKSESAQPFFYWLDIGDGKEVNLDRCPRNTLQNQSIKYLGPNERKSYEVIVEDGKLVYKQSHILLNTGEGSKWIFVLSTMSALYVGKKKKGKFQHSSFLSGGAITAAGRLVVKEGVLKAIWPHSGHYLPTEEHFKAFINFLEDNNVDLTEVKRGAIDDYEYPSFKRLDSEPENKVQKVMEEEEYHSTAAEVEDLSEGEEEEEEEEEPTKVHMTKAPFRSEINTERLPCNWTTGAGPRIGCVRDYPINLQSKALEQVNLSPRISILVTRGGSKDPIPSPRPTPRVRLSPRLASMGIPSPKSPWHFSDQRHLLQN